MKVSKNGPVAPSATNARRRRRGDARARRDRRATAGPSPKYIARSARPGCVNVTHHAERLIDQRRIGCRIDRAARQRRHVVDPRHRRLALRADSRPWPSLGASARIRQQQERAEEALRSFREIPRRRRRVRRAFGVARRSPPSDSRSSCARRSSGRPASERTTVENSVTSSAGDVVGGDRLARHRAALRRRRSTVPPPGFRNVTPHRRRRRRSDSQSGCRW